MVFANNTDMGSWMSANWFSFSTSFKASGWRIFSHRRHPEIIILIVNKLSSNSVLLVEVVSNSDSPVWDFEIPKPIISQSHPVSGDIFICQTKYKTFSLHHNFLLILEIFQSPQLESGNLYLKPGISWMWTYLIFPPVFSAVYILKVYIFGFSWCFYLVYFLNILVSLDIRFLLV